MNRKGFSLVIIVVIVALIGIVVAYYLGTQNNIIPNIKVDSTPNNTISPSPTNNKVDWKTYSGNDFTFQHPTDWDTYKLGETLMVAPQATVNDVKKMQGGFGGGNFLVMLINTSKNAPKMENDEYQKVVSEPITINGITATKYTIESLQDLPGTTKGDIRTSVVFKKADMYIQIDLLEQKHKDIYNDILSTFKLKN